MSIADASPEHFEVMSRAPDRLLHRSTVLNLSGESYRLRDKRKTGLALPSPAELAKTAASVETEADRAAESPANE